jgi:predicted nucleotidyltransferase
VRAAQILGSRILPSNLEVALELDRIAEEKEGSNRKHRLIHMRTEAFFIMKLLRAYHPLLIGSTWRGTIRRGSDVDIALCHDDPEEVVALLKAEGFEILKTGWTTVNKAGKDESSFHIYTKSKSDQEIELVVRRLDELGEGRKCHIFGDKIKGLNLQELETVLKENPERQFLPE